MSRKRLALFAALTALVLVMAGCSKEEPAFTAEDQIPEDLVATEDEGGGEGEDGAAGGGETLHFTAADIKFADAPATAPAGTVTIELVNEGGSPHDVTFEELGDDPVVVAQGGETATGTAELEPGTYTYYCSVPGHRSAGMEGELTVE
ncbi:MAG TPA: plastocyanin/azurin family copper-binding protein [Egibacteraceae bacterium]|nr:plastocyanin/azurin family copper-binding protein [Egibacteraceae bacterium]